MRNYNVYMDWKLGSPIRGWSYAFILNKYDNHLNSVQVNTLYYHGCVAWACYA